MDQNPELTVCIIPDKLAAEDLSVNKHAEPTFGLPYSQYMQKLYQKNSLFDACLINGGRIFPIHRMMLAAHSPRYFEVFDPNKQTTSCYKIELERTVSKETMEILINYLYENGYTLNEENIEDVLFISIRLNLPQLGISAIQFINDSANTDNALYFLHLVNLYDLVGIRDGLLKFVTENFEALDTNGLAFLNLDYEDLSEILVLVLEKESHAKTKLRHRRAVKRWINAWPNKRSKMAASLHHLLCVEEISPTNLVAEMEMKSDLTVFRRFS